MILYLQVDKHSFQPKNLLLSSCLGLSKTFDKFPLAKGIAKTSKASLTVPDLGDAWLPLLALDRELSQRAYRRASDRIGPPPRISVEELVRATSGTFPLLRWLARSSQNQFNAKASGPQLLKRLEGRTLPRTRLLTAAFRKGALAALPDLLQDHERIRNSPLLGAALVHFALSAEEGPLAERESWKLAIEVLPKIHRPQLAELLQALVADPGRAELWQAFYRERERIFFRLGLPSQPELAAWGTPQEILSGGGD